ncbi:phosphoenolpyruvate synthase [Sphingomonas sp.]|jgi:pyruvate,water dikinase|uniref:phosphoenolpyruvate synthase n=1 Tax=Sphingomonas sp. TaxID=28214 RepID=UPI00260246E3|nr:phosphoenolpyruvate synthase [Sphingomonas sp.]MDF2493260.1 phosphoenolpyruvate synthase [Sphingomonas sp.]
MTDMIEGGARDQDGRQASLIVSLDELRAGDVPLVGGKNASLGEMLHALKGRGIRVPEGFATTANAYRHVLSAARIGDQIAESIAAMRAGRATLVETGEAIRLQFLEAELPADLAEGIVTAYRDLGRRHGIDRPSVAVRSSATAEDLPDASFAGQQETFLNVRGERGLLDACRRCYASLFTNRAISYREAKGFDHQSIALSIGVQLMVRSDLAGSGVMFTLDPETGFPKVAVVSAAWGLGETVVQGSVDPDIFTVFKPLANDAHLVPIVERKLGAKAQKMIFHQGGSARTKTVETSHFERARFVLSDAEVLQLTRWAVLIEEHYGRPMDIEWAKDGETEELFIVQARPETVQSARHGQVMRTWHLQERGPVLTTGAAVGDMICSGQACIIRSPTDIGAFRDGSILIAENTDPDWVPIMRRAAGIITNHGGTTSHAAIVSRELGVPAVVGTGNATAVIEDGAEITLSCGEGDTGRVYAGALAFTTDEIAVADLPPVRTELMINSGDPAQAFRWWRLPIKGVGLARMEFIVSTLIKVHPMALVHPEQVSDPEERRAIDQLIAGHVSGADFFVETLASGIAKIAAGQMPRPVIVRLSDFKTNEYRHLLGGAAFEPVEANPMLGFRGASRYAHPRYRDGFALECRALRRAREVMGMTNIIVMVPFCRTIAEAEAVLAEMSRHGLERSERGLQIYMMCEVPSNVVLAEEFSQRFDGFSIGSNDLTQLMLGADRDSDLLSELFDERDPAVLRTIGDFIRRAHVAGRKVGICGQAPSDHPEFAAFLVSEKIDSISLNPDSFVKTLRHVAKAEETFAGR